MAWGDNVNTEVAALRNSAINEEITSIRKMRRRESRRCGNISMSMFSTRRFVRHWCYSSFIAELRRAATSHLGIA